MQLAFSHLLQWLFILLSVFFLYALFNCLELHQEIRLSVCESKTGLNPRVVFLLTIQRQFICCSSSLCIGGLTILRRWSRCSFFAKSFQQMQDSCRTDWNFWQDKIKFCRTGGLSVIKLQSFFHQNHRTFVRQTEIFCRTERKFAGFVRQSCSFREDWVLLTLCCFVVYSTRRFVLPCVILFLCCCFLCVFFSQSF